MITKHLEEKDSHGQEETPKEERKVTSTLER
jgi:hypothetical protein